MNDPVGSGEHSRFFSKYAPVGKYLTNFDTAVHAIFLAIPDLQSRMGSLEKAVILVDSKPAIETIALHHLQESLFVSKVKQFTRELTINCKIVEFLWIPSHVDVDDNERAVLLAKGGTIYMEYTG
ncbi:hypothetical protein NPIL_369681 [Nephila pilipes]|uniref:RNase H type-1 domain-containing protein n=1 Tax=Nephila pilipes TaxID=299642 RepID=A0A8X6QDR5_NEPPI|nr:hypothetical protein NPIL_369681 [Nephila pilipes]